MGPAGVRLAGWGFRHATRRAWAVRDVDLVLEPGERVLLTGPSGSGKATLLRGLAGLLEPESGDVAGELTVDGGPAVRRRHRIGMVFQDPDSQLVMTRSGDDVAFGLENVGTPPELIWPAVDRALDLVGFPYGRDRPTAALSGGQKQRLVLAGALAGTMAAVLDLIYWYPDWTGGWKTTYVLLVVASTTVLAGVGGMVLARSLAASGALSSLAAARDRV